MLEQLAEAQAHLFHVAWLDSRRLRQPGPHLGLVELEDQVVGTQARDIPRRVEAFQRVVEIVGQEDLLDVGSPQDLLFPVGLGHQALGGVAQPGAVGRRDALALEAEEGASNVEEPGILHRVIDAVEVLQQDADALARVDAGGKAGLRHAGGVGELGVVVVAEDVVEAARGRAVRVDVRMRVDQRDSAKGAIQVLRQRVAGHCFNLKSGRPYKGLARITNIS